MARARRIIGRCPVPKVEAALGALCISSLLFLSLLLTMQRAPGHGAGFLRIVLVNAPSPMSAHSSATGSAAAILSKPSTIDDGEKFSDGDDPGNVLADIAMPAGVVLERSGYLPVKQLSVRPVVMEDIAPDLPAGVDVSDQSELILQLLINEYGDVDRVIVDDGTLPASVMAELTQRFLHMRFFPGRLDGRAVPTALRIAVTLHTNLLP